MKTYIVKQLDQAALLTDEFKLKLLEQFADEPKTTKQVADALQMKQTRLYRHIDALFQAGLLRLVRERQKRGTVERYYKTIAARFEIDSSLFGGSEGEQSEAVEVVRSILSTTEREVVELLERQERDEDPAAALDALLMRISVEGTPSQLSLLREKLSEWMDACEKTTIDEDEPLKLSYRGLVMFYPVQDEGYQD